MFGMVRYSDRPGPLSTTDVPSGVSDEPLAPGICLGTSALCSGLGPLIDRENEIQQKPEPLWDSETFSGLLAGGFLEVVIM